MPKISVIIPVYRVEDYLPQCLESISRQTCRDFELILVDDGSPDRCGAICDRYAADHDNTRVIHQENMGLSEARNQGVKIAAGDYVVFVDSDDYVTEDYLEHLLYLAEKYGADVAVAERVNLWDGEPEPNIERENTERVLTPAQALIDICYNKMPICAWGKIYRRELAEQYPYPKGQLYEDTATTYKLVGAARVIAYSSRVVYFWRQRRDSITHSAITEKHLYGITAAKEQIEYMETHYPEAVPAARTRCVMKIIDLAYRLVAGKYDAALFDRIRRELKPYLKPLLQDRKAGRSLKLRAMALDGGYIPFLLLSKVYTLAKKAVGGA